MELITETSTNFTLHLTESEMRVLLGVMSHVQLGQNTELSELAFNILVQHEDKNGNTYDYDEFGLEFYNEETDEVHYELGIREA